MHVPWLVCKGAGIQTSGRLALQLTIQWPQPHLVQGQLLTQRPVPSQLFSLLEITISPPLYLQFSKVKSLKESQVKYGTLS